MLLTNLIASLIYTEVKNIDLQDITSLAFDSREATTGSLFFAIRGTVVDGHNYIKKAIDNGCRAVVCEVLPSLLDENVTYVTVTDSSVALATLSSVFYGNPSSKLKLVGVTGTNGKTTIATLLYNLFKNLGYKVGLISTVTYKIDDIEIKSTHTTPDVVRLNKYIAEMVEAGCSYCFIEVSSHSIVQNRVLGLDFDVAIFTNITHDHLDYHGSFAEYIKAKKMLFDGLKKSAFAIYNGDDRNGSVIVQNSRAKNYSFGLRGLADFKCLVLESHFEGTLLEINGTELWSRLIGRFNAANTTCVYAAATLLGESEERITTAISVLTTVDGRFDNLRSASGVTAIIDYAHTPDALQNVLATINDIKRPSQKVICVVGCGGDRDKTKRPEMGEIAVKNADHTIFTSDNPRSEDPEAILTDIIAGVTEKYQLSFMKITDRREAIKSAVIMAKSGDIILVAGKGHETYQEIKGVRTHFSDKEEIIKLFR